MEPRIRNEKSQDLRQLSPKARKYVRALCDSDFTKKLKDTSSNNDKRVSFSGDTKTHVYPILTGKRHIDLEDLPCGLTPSADKDSPASSILKKQDEYEIHEPPTRRHSFPFAKPKIRALQRLSELVNAKKKRRGSSSLQSVTEEEDNENAILDFPEPSAPVILPLRRLSSPEIDLICPFDDRPRRASRSSETASVRSRFSIRRGSIDLAKIVSSTVRRLSRGSSFSSEEGEQGTFEGPLWTDKFDLDLPESIRPDLTELDFLIRTQREEKEGAKKEKAREMLGRLSAMRARLEERERAREEEEDVEMQCQTGRGDFGDADADFDDDLYELEEGRKRVERALRLSTIHEHEEGSVDQGGDMAFNGWRRGIGAGNCRGIEWTIPVY